MKVMIKNGQGQQSEIDPKDITINGKTLEQVIEDIKQIKKDLQKHISEEQMNAMEARALWQKIKK